MVAGFVACATPTTRPIAPDTTGILASRAGPVLSGQTGDDLVGGHRRTQNAGYWPFHVPVYSRYHDYMSKPMTVRLTEEQQAELAAVARADGTSVAEAVRTAIEAHIAARRKNKSFQERLAKIIERDRELLERLAK